MDKGLVGTILTGALLFGTVAMVPKGKTGTGMALREKRIQEKFRKEDKNIGLGLNLRCKTHQLMLFTPDQMRALILLWKEDKPLNDQNLGILMEME